MKCTHCGYQGAPICPKCNAEGSMNPKIGHTASRIDNLRKHITKLEHELRTARAQLLRESGMDVS